MMVTFISQCEKKAISKTRRVLDSFANRIGDRTWQTVITQEGLQAVKKLLKKTASKNTAVSCHWIRSRSRSELVWIVGSREKFSSEGFVPIHETEKDLLKSILEDDWHYLPLIKALVRISALFHDFGKANKFFQDKLKSNKNTGDPVRHEWISAQFFSAFTINKTDEEWLEELISGDIDFTNYIDTLQSIKTLFKKLTPLASLIVWLILTHHRLPWSKEDGKGYIDYDLKDYNILLSSVIKTWNYENKFKESDLLKNYLFPKGLPTTSKKWIKEIKKAGKKLLDCFPLFNDSMGNGTWRLILQYSRLALMFGDHYFSSLEGDSRWDSKQKIYANSKKGKSNKKIYDQKLDEHLIGVTKRAVRIAHLLPSFESRNSEFQSVYDKKVFKQKTNKKKFKWQDKAVTKIVKWREENLNIVDNSSFGFFAVNMASTGMGKTFANAKIMRSLSPNMDSLRYILALGLRTLTLQTGKEYRSRLELEKDELAVLIGSKAVHDIFEKNNGESSSNDLLDNEIDFESDIPECELKTVIETKKHRQFLYAPILTCTIDHLMSATESTRGGKHILPTLRLMSSDLVIDEIDDFDGEDLVAIGRFIHLAGMLGRKVMISSATIPPDLAEGYFNAYKEGWSLHAKSRGGNNSIGCAWIDEFSTNCNTVLASEPANTKYKELHKTFVDKRIIKLKKQVVKRKLDIKLCGDKENYFQYFKEAIEVKHRDHNNIDSTSKRRVSFGVVRTANINPCVELTRFLLNANWDQDTEIKAMAYHSRQVLLMRSEQERVLDEILKTDDNSHLNNSMVQKHLKNSKKKNLIYILVATPVEEVGRDHDFDWAVIEPSSYRSIIQLAGRVLRHRDRNEDIDKPNITIMQFNKKAIEGEKTAYNRPGYETEKSVLESHDISKILDIDKVGKCLDATYRVSREDVLNPKSSLIDLEHHTMEELLTSYNNNKINKLQGWLTNYWWLSGFPQFFIKFRRSTPTETMFLKIDENGEYGLSMKSPITGELEIQEFVNGIEQNNNLTVAEEKNLWFFRDYESLLKDMGEESIDTLALKYGEINIPNYDERARYIYSNQFGLILKK